MNEHYDRYLTKKYAPLYRDRYGDMRATAMCWGFECGDGWFNLINTLSELLCNDWLYAKEKYERLKALENQKEFGEWAVDFNDTVTPKRIEQARLEMLEEEAKIPVVTQVKEKYGKLNFYTDLATEEQQAYINFAYLMSAYTCEVCGNKGKLNRSGWIAARCKEHEEY